MTPSTYKLQSPKSPTPSKDTRRGKIASADFVETIKKSRNDNFSLVVEVKRDEFKRKFPSLRFCVHDKNWKCISINKVNEKEKLLICMMVKIPKRHDFDSITKRFKVEAFEHVSRKFVQAKKVCRIAGSFTMENRERKRKILREFSQLSHAGLKDEIFSLSWSWIFPWQGRSFPCTSEIFFIVESCFKVFPENLLKLKSLKKLLCFLITKHLKGKTTEFSFLSISLKLFRKFFPSNDKTLSYAHLRFLLHIHDILWNGVGWAAFFRFFSFYSLCDFHLESLLSADYKTTKKALNRLNNHYIVVTKLSSWSEI